MRWMATLNIHYYTRIHIFLCTHRMCLCVRWQRINNAQSGHLCLIINTSYRLGRPGGATAAAVYLRVCSRASKMCLHVVFATFSRAGIGSPVHAKKGKRVEWHNQTASSHRATQLACTFPSVEIRAPWCGVTDPNTNHRAHKYALLMERMQSWCSAPHLTSNGTSRLQCTVITHFRQLHSYFECVRRSASAREGERELHVLL